MVVWLQSCLSMAALPLLSIFLYSVEALGKCNCAREALNLTRQLSIESLARAGRDQSRQSQQRPSMHCRRAPRPLSQAWQPPRNQFVMALAVSLADASESTSPPSTGHQRSHRCALVLLGASTVLYRRVLLWPRPCLLVAYVLTEESVGWGEHMRSFGGRSEGRRAAASARWLAAQAQQSWR